MRLLAIRSPSSFHLDEPEIDAKLQLLLPVASQDFPNLDRAGLVRPIP
jgi:hypothetical protein